MPWLPLFPLTSVLFPGGTLPLHIFEERYRRMVAECIDGESAFGVVLIRSGAEVGDYAEPHNVGTTARILRADRLPDGRLNIVTVGVDRFRIVRTDRSLPYLQGEVEYLSRSHKDTDAARSAAELVRELFSAFYRQTLILADQWTSRVPMPRDPARLVDFVAARLDIDLQVKQKLLETDDVQECLDLEARLLRGTVEVLEGQVHQKQRAPFVDQWRLN